jgi:hypothetical protein
VLSRAQLDACRIAGSLSDSANPLNCLAELFNNYSELQPQNEMVKYVNDAVTGIPRRISPWEPSSDEWAELSTQAYDNVPTNLNRSNVLRNAAWIKNTWNDVWKYLH